MKRVAIYALAATSFMLLVLALLPPVWVSVYEAYDQEAADILLDIGLASCMTSLATSIFALYLYLSGKHSWRVRKNFKRLAWRLATMIGIGS